MKAISLKNLLLAALVVASFTACSDDAANKAITENQAYIPNAFESKTQETYVDAATNVTVPVSLSQPDATQEVEVTVTTPQEALDAYNSRWKTNLIMYPSELWKLSSGTVKIDTGSVRGTTTLELQPMSKELAGDGNLYAIPVTITAATGGVSILKGSETYIYTLKRTPRSNVLLFEQGSNPTSTADMVSILLPMRYTDSDVNYEEKNYQLRAYTYEYLLKIKKWRNANNCCILYAPDGDDGGEIYSRIENGSNGIDKAVFNAKTWGDEGSISSEAGSVVLDKWIHVAFTFGDYKLKCFVNGVEVISKDVNFDSFQVNAGKLEFRGGANTNAGTGAPSKNEVMVAELRYWNVARTAEQLKSYRYAVDPTTPGLLGYWKFDDAPDENGYVSTVKDYTGRNADGHCVFFTQTNTPPAKLKSLPDEYLVDK